MSNRRVDVLAEGFDVALRVRTRPSGEDGLVMRTFREVDEFLVASPEYLGGAAPLTEPADLRPTRRSTTRASSSAVPGSSWDRRARSLDRAPPAHRLP